jgi:hypothetical protein
MYLCNGFAFNDLQEASDYANYYFDLTGIVCAIERIL